MLKKFTYSLIISFAVIAIASCSNLDRYFELKQKNKATTVSKSSKSSQNETAATETRPVVGLVTGDKERELRKKALIGAGYVPLKDDFVSYYLDVQEVKLRQKLTGTGVNIIRKDDYLVINMPSNITFNTGSSTTNEKFFTILDSVIIVIQEYEKTLIEVVGHTDSVGSQSFNKSLSEERAASIVEYLMRQNVEPLRLGIYGYGENYPIAGNDTEQGRAQNRRVEIALVPIVST